MPMQQGKNHPAWLPGFHYHLIRKCFAQEVFELYGLGGLNFAHAGYNDPNGNNDYSNNEFGLNLGIGSNFQIGKTFVPFAELRFTLGEYDQFMLGLGVKFNVGK